MPAYLIVVAQLHDRQAFIDGYGKAAAGVVEKHGGRYFLRASGATALEGGWGDGASVVIEEWPDRAAAERFWNSPEYTEIKRLREGLADVKVWLIEAPKIES